MNELALLDDEAERSQAQVSMPATTRTALDAAAKRLMRARAELQRLQVEVSA